jgi:putative membrane protein
MATEENKSESTVPVGQTKPAAEPTLLARIGAMLTGSRPPDSEANAPKSSNELAEERTDLAIKRTLMGADRTLMAWVRTALSMIGFGFTIYKVLQGFQEGGGGLVSHDYEPRNVGLFLVVLGTISMVLGTIEYWQTLKELRLLTPIRIMRPSFIMALIISVAGVSVFVSIAANLL